MEDFMFKIDPELFEKQPKTKELWSLRMPLFPK